MRRYVRSLSIYDYQFLISTSLHAYFPSCATHGAGVAGTNTYPSIPNTPVNVMRPKRPSWTSPLTKANRASLFLACVVYPNMRHVCLYSLAFQKHHPCLRRELPCHSHTRKPNLAHRTRHPRLQTPSNKSPRVRLCGKLINMQLGMSA
jgi:hypothetical protein